jgi:hypothetical protein
MSVTTSDIRQSSLVRLEASVKVHETLLRKIRPRASSSTGYIQFNDVNLEMSARSCLNEVGARSVAAYFAVMQSQAEGQMSGMIEIGSLSRFIGENSVAIIAQEPIEFSWTPSHRRARKAVKDFCGTLDADY